MIAVELDLTIEHAKSCAQKHLEHKEEYDPIDRYFNFYTTIAHLK